MIKMLNSLYIEAARKKGTIKEVLPEIEGESIVKKNWEDKIFLNSLDEFSIAAGDGSFNKKKFIGYTFYAVAAESLIFDEELKKIESVEINTQSHISYIDELLSNYMSIFELKNCLRAIKDYDIDYYLFDGSIYGDLQNPFPKSAETSQEAKENIKDVALDDLKRIISQRIDKKASSPDLIKKYFNIYKDKEDYNLYLTTLEKLLVLSEILKDSKKIIAISKSSDNDDIFHSNIPDIAIFDKYTKNQGISKIVYKNVSKDIKLTFPVCDDFFKQLKFTIFYLRLDDHKNVLKVELPYEASVEEITEIVEKIKKISTNGYPYLLKKAHNDVVISDNNIKQLLNIVKIREKSGREMLN